MRPALAPRRGLGDDGDLVRDEEGGVEADPELPDEVRRVRAGAQCLGELLRPGRRDAAEVLLELLPREPDT